MYLWRKIKYTKMSREVNKLFANSSIPEVKSSEYSDDYLSKVGVVQLRYLKLKNVRDFVSLILNSVEALVSKKVDFIIFPYKIHNLIFHDFDKLRNIREIDKISEILTKIFTKISSRFRIWIYGGEFRFTVKNKLYRRFFLFSPQGNPIIETTDDRIESPLVFSTDRFRFSPMSSEELMLYEFVKMAILKGAEILIESDHPYNNRKGLEYRKGLWSRCQQFNVYGINSYIVGKTPWGIFKGPSGIYGPYWIFKDGVVEKAKEGENGIIYATLKRINGRNNKLSNDLNYGKILEVMFKD